MDTNDTSSNKDTSKRPTQHTHTIEDNFHNARLDRFLKHHYPEISHSHIHKMCRNKDIRVNNQRTSFNAHLQKGDSLRIYIIPQPTRAEKRSPQRKISPPTKEDLAFVKKHTLFENDHVIAINKPTGLPTQDGTNVQTFLLQILERTQGTPLHIVHRLDKETSGIILFAKTRSAAQILAKSFHDKEIQKEYVAIVNGKLPHRTGTIKQSLHAGDSQGPLRPAETSYHQIHTEKQRDITLSKVLLQPITGRKHQIRLHLRHMKTPVLGDEKYGNWATNEKAVRYGVKKRLFLHAWKMTLPKAIKSALQVKEDLEAPVPESFNLF